MVGSGLLCAHPGVGNYLITSVGNSVITEVGNYLIIFPQKVGNLADRRHRWSGRPSKKDLHVLQSISALVRNNIPERDEGQGLVEYGLILAGVSIAALVALFAL